uniref:Uncharacterized protein n=1 Tax=uncultured organism MedDCM-OCT-S08-C100 TaxID=743626 RepID=D6PJ51_9ZZZZ|nr:hypothetical protein [uncultured organism MedDCM-OCT-S08-C100]
MVAKPRELTAFLEEISGSIMYKPKYDLYKGSLEDIDNEIFDLTKELTLFRSEKRKLRAQKSNSEIYQKLLVEIDALEIKKQILKFLKIDQELIATVQKFQKFNGRLKKVKDKMEVQR